jgi:hypothetical protein
MLIHCFRLLARVGEDRHVEAKLGLRLTGQQEQTGALDPRTEVEDMILPHVLFLSLIRSSLSDHQISSPRHLPTPRSLVLRRILRPIVVCPEREV